MFATRVITCAAYLHSNSKKTKQKRRPIKNEFVTYFDVKHLNNKPVINDVPDDAPIVKWEKSNLDDFDRMFTSDSKR